LFVPAGRDPEDGALEGSFREAWLDYGLGRARELSADAPDWSFAA
jgi:hypothetical protein